MTAPVTDIVDAPAPPPAPAGVPAVVAVRAATTRRLGGGLLAVIERRLGLTPLGVGALVLAIGMIVVGRAVPSRGMTVLGYGLVLVLGVSYALGRRNLPIDAERSQIPSRISARRTVEASLSFTSRRRLTSLVIEEVLPVSLGGPVRVGIPTLPSGVPVEHAYAFTPTQRGVYQVGPLVAEYSDPFGLTRRRQVLTAATPIVVHPRVEPIIDRISNREWEDPPIRPPFSRAWPSGFEFYGMREYQHGDDPRRIVWRALAQYDKYLIRESEQGITDRVHIYLDSAADSHSPGRPSETFETGVSVAASLAARHLSDGLAVSIDTNAEERITRARGLTKRIPVLDALAAVSLERVALTTMLDRLFTEARSNAHNVLITPGLDQASTARLRVMLDGGMSLLLVLLVSDSTEPMTLHRAATLRCNVVEVSRGAPLGALFARVVGGRSR